MRLSIGSAGKLGLISIRQSVKPTTCYVMLGKRCMNNCLFCSQSTDASKLSRIHWPDFDEDTAIEKINKSCFKRVCLQCTSSGIYQIIQVIKKIKKPLSISYNFDNISDIKKAIRHAERICIPLDAADQKTYQKMKGTGFEKKKSLIIKAARLFPKKITTHIIIGLGESEEDVLSLIRLFVSEGITIGFFAFTPVPKTRLENQKPPDLRYYRRVQAQYYMIKNKTDKIDPEAFQTSGCDNCNRPFYNEGPAGPIYNFPRRLTGKEYENAKKDMAAHN